MKSLTQKDQIFVRLVSIDGNATEAVKKAYGITNDGTARTKGYRLLTNADILAAIEERKKNFGNRFDDDEVAEIHRSNLTARRLDHMTFPTGPKTTADKENYLALERAKAEANKKEYVEKEVLSDEEIKDLLASANCVMRKVVHGEMARHVYFWAPDGMTRDKALDKVYKLKGSYAPEKAVNVNIDLDVMSPEAKKIAEEYEQKLKAAV